MCNETITRNMHTIMERNTFYSKLGIILYIFVCTANAYEVCSTDLFNSYKYCEDGTYCCHNGSQCCSSFGTVGAIVGVAIGGVVFLGIVVSFRAVRVFGFGEHRGSSGNVITPNTGTQIHMVSTGRSQPGTGLAYPTYMPPYGASGSQTTSFGTTPSYPPAPPMYGITHGKA